MVTVDTRFTSFGDGDLCGLGAARLVIGLISGATGFCAELNSSRTVKI